ncbi:helix-turn-helix domain-containing protein [Streptomyces herbicida]
MGRRERQLDPAAGPVQSFAFELRKLRQEAGALTYRAMAQRTGYSMATLSRAASGERLPSRGGTGVCGSVRCGCLRVGTTLACGAPGSGRRVAGRRRYAGPLPWAGPL